LTLSLQLTSLQLSRAKSPNEPRFLLGSIVYFFLGAAKLRAATRHGEQALTASTAVKLMHRNRLMMDWN